MTLRIFPFFFLLILSLKSWSQVINEEIRPAVNRGTEEFLKDYLSIKYPGRKFTDFIYVGVKRQELYLFRGGELLKVYPVSTSKHGAGSVEGSEMTPVGLHKVHGKFGEDIPENGILKHKRFTGELAEIEYRPMPINKDIITTRVITIEGLERGVNKGGKLDSYDRHIYIHGTAEEGLIGQPASHGCVRLKNKDVMDLFDLLSKGMYVIILNN
ncbi:MAG: L,D-transpeptidase [Flavobacteriales bacterium]|jgi:hypothetical protein|nr:L,D-transpeptidase [Flavobacteriales bacterium]